MEVMTIFSKIINKEIPADILYEDEEVLAFRDINPKAPVHVLIIPRKPLKDIGEATDEDAMLLGRCMLVAGKLARELGVAESGYRLVTNKGEAAGQTVFHLHFHLLGGRDFSWPPG
jgi:histidine triad (HIT) family protein